MGDAVAQRYRRGFSLIAFTFVLTQCGTVGDLTINYGPGWLNRSDNGSLEITETACSRASFNDCAE